MSTDAKLSELTQKAIESAEMRAVCAWEFEMDVNTAIYRLSVSGEDALEVLNDLLVKTKGRQERACQTLDLLRGTK